MPRPKTRNADLRVHMLESSLAMLESGGPMALTAREVASSAGTSTAALYELFGDKAGLIRGVFYEGFDRLAARLDALPTTDDPRSDLIASLEIARELARSSPMLHEVMYARPFAEFEPDAHNVDAAASIYKHYTGRVARWLDKSRRGTAVADAAQALVAANRGLISTELAGVLGSNPTSVARRRRLTIDALLDGLQQTSKP